MPCRARYEKQQKSRWLFELEHAKCSLHKKWNKYPHPYLHDGQCRTKETWATAEEYTPVLTLGFHEQDINSIIHLCIQNSQFNSFIITSSAGTDPRDDLVARRMWFAETRVLIDVLTFYPASTARNGVPYHAVRSCVRREMYATTAQNIQTASVGANHNKSKHSYICMFTSQFAGQFSCEYMILLRTKGPIFI